MLSLSFELNEVLEKKALTTIKSKYVWKSLIGPSELSLMKEHINNAIRI